MSNSVASVSAYSNHSQPFQDLGVFLPGNAISMSKFHGCIPGLETRGYLAIDEESGDVFPGDAESGLKIDEVVDSAREWIPARDDEVLSWSINRTEILVSAVVESGEPDDRAAILHLGSDRSAWTFSFNGLPSEIEIPALRELAARNPQPVSEATEDSTNRAPLALVSACVGTGELVMKHLPWLGPIELTQEELISLTQEDAEIQALLDIFEENEEERLIALSFIQPDEETGEPLRSLRAVMRAGRNR